MNRARLSVPLITCSACVETIEALFENDKNIKIRVLLVPEKEAIVFYDPNHVTLQSIRQKIEDVGFDSEIVELENDIQNRTLEKRTEFIIEGMTCNSCTGKDKICLLDTKLLFLGTIRDALSEHVLSCDISLERKTALVTFNEFEISSSKIISIIEDVGFECKVKPASSTTLENKILKVLGMVCKSCVQTIEGVLKEHF